MSRSVRQTPHTDTRTRISPSPGVGTGMSAISSRGSSLCDGPRRINARIEYIIGDETVAGNPARRLGRLGASAALLAARKVLENLPGWTHALRRTRGMGGES